LPPPQPLGVGRHGLARGRRRSAGAYPTSLVGGRPASCRPGGGGKDVFVHISAVEKAGLSGLNEGQIVDYDEVPNKGKTSAENLKVQR
jgi:CspA family cold shock protein